MAQSEWELEHQKQLIKEFKLSSIYNSINTFYQDNNLVFTEKEFKLIISHAATLWEAYSRDKRLGYTNTFWCRLYECYENYPELFTVYESVSFLLDKFLIFVDKKWENIANETLKSLDISYTERQINLPNCNNLIVFSVMETINNNKGKVLLNKKNKNIGQRIFAELQEIRGIKTTVLWLKINDEFGGGIAIQSRGDTLELFQNNYRKSNSFIREDLKQLFRSTWEANIARFFNYCDITWEYEPSSLFTGDVFYKSDFLCSKSVVVEVKGYWDSQSLKKVSEFQKRYAQYKIGFIDRDLYKEINSDYGKIIKNWEYEQVSIESQMVPIVGLSFVKDKTVFSEISIGEEVFLVREPHNTYDKNAIAVYSLNKKLLGHIAAEWALIYSQKIDFGMIFSAIISKIESKSILLKIKKVSTSPDTVDNFIKFFKGY